MFTILAQGRWSRLQVSSIWVQSTRGNDAKIDREIEEAWTRASSREGIHLFDGLMCRLESFRASNEQLELRLSETSYKIFLGTHFDGGDRFESAYRANPVGLSPI